MPETFVDRYRQLENIAMSSLKNPSARLAVRKSFLIGAEAMRDAMLPLVESGNLNTFVVVSEQIEELRAEIQREQDAANGNGPRNHAHHADPS